MMQEENEALRPGVFPLGARGLIAFLAFLSAFVPLSIDLYLPAMPKMVGFFSTTPELTNFTLSFFMLFFAISMYNMPYYIIFSVINTCRRAKKSKFVIGMHYPCRCAPSSLQFA